MTESVPLQRFSGELEQALTTEGSVVDLRLLDAQGAEAHPRPPSDAALIVPTSGSSSGTGRPVWLSADALRHSAASTHTALNGPGHWGLVLPLTHIAGVQVVVRAILARESSPWGEVIRGSDIAAVAAELPHSGPRYISVVPTQLRRAVDDPRQRAALATFDAVLVGGAGLDPLLREQAEHAGVAIVTTYGMTETAGGCVYNGTPLPEVSVRIRDEAIEIAGPMLAGGYLDAEPGSGTVEGHTQGPFFHEDGVRWFRTSDRGALDPTGKLEIWGRGDGVINTGGEKVHPAAVEHLLAGVLTDYLVLGVADEEWGELVTVVTSDQRVELSSLRRHIGTGPLSPRGLLVLPELPRVGLHKVDRARVREWVQVPSIAAQIHRW